VVWLYDPTTDSSLLTAVAEETVRRTEAADGGPDIEVLAGSFDPPGARLLDLVEVMDTLRRECPWDQRQTHESLVHYLLEETYETVEAIETGALDHLREELGDLLLQVMFHARIATEHEHAPFDIDDVAGEIVDKLVRRHPHVFADTIVSGAADVEVNWESIKAAEKSRESSTDGIPLGLPALSLAHKVANRCRAGRFTPVPLAEEGTNPSAEEGATSGGPDALTARSLGDALLDLVVRAEAAGLDPEQALRQRVRALMDQVRSHEQRALADEAADRR
jgi:XTP/dITP diphosphohydrolase